MSHNERNKECDGDLRRQLLQQGVADESDELPRLNRVPRCSVVCGLVFLAAFGAFFAVWMMEDDDVYYKGEAWRLTSNVRQEVVDPFYPFEEWEVCSLSFFSDELCTVPINVTNVTGSGFSSIGPIPDQLFVEDNPCSQSVVLMNTSSTKPDINPYLGFHFSRAITVECAQVETPSSYSGHLTLSVDGQSVVNHESYYSIAELSQSTHVNALWTTFLVVWIVMASFCFFAWCVFVPIWCCAAGKSNKYISQLEEELKAGKVMQWKCDESQWQVFSDQNFGPGGSERKKSPLWLYMVAGVVAGPVAMLGIKLKSLTNDVSLSWLMCAEIGLPSGFAFCLFVWILIRVSLCVKYHRMRRNRWRCVVGASSIYFGSIYALSPVFKSGLAPRLVTLGSAIVRTETEGGAVFVLKCNKFRKMNGTKPEFRKFTLRIPVSDRAEPALKEFLNQHQTTYKFQSQP